MANVRVNHKERVVLDPEILLGKPVVKGTRISVEEVLARLAEIPSWMIC